MRLPSQGVFNRLLLFCLTTMIIGAILTATAYVLKFSFYPVSADLSRISEHKKTDANKADQLARNNHELVANPCVKTSLKDLNLRLWLVGVFVLLLSVLSAVILRYLVLEPIKKDFYRQLTCLTVAASHQLRNSLTAVSVSAEVMASRLKQLDPSEETEIFTIIDATRQLSQLAEDLLFLIRAEVNAISVKTVSFPIHEVLEDLVDRFELEAKERCITFNMDLSTDVIICGDPEQISQLFLNVLETVFEQTQPHEKIVLRLKKEGTFAVVYMRNTDENIIAQQPSTICFPPWLHSSRSDLPQPNEELGLHLLTAQAIAQCHGGDLATGRYLKTTHHSSFRVELPFV